MLTRTSGRAPVKLLVLFVVLAAGPLVALGWLGRRVLQQDQALESQQLKDRLESAAALAAAEIDRRLTAWEELLAATGQGKPVAVPETAALLVFDADGVRQHLGVALPYYPRVATSPEPAAEFARGEALEFQQHNLGEAEAEYRRLAAHTDRSVRAAALMRLARCLRRQDRLREALNVYNAMTVIDDAWVAGSPAALVARGERATLFTTLGDGPASAHESAQLAADLAGGRLTVDRATYDMFAEKASVSSQISPTAVALADAAADLWSRWQTQPSGRAAWSRSGHALAIAWKHTTSGSAAILGGVDTLMSTTTARFQRLGVVVTLVDPANGPAWPNPVPSEPLPTPGILTVTKTVRETGLPWAIDAFAMPAVDAKTLASRRTLLAAGFTLMVVVIAVAGYFVFRSVNRELGVARLQSDFVAAVSHEFRTPLTAMRHLTEMLEEGGASHERLPDYYRALGKETRRLHGMVENLLDFGRLESGRRSYAMNDADASALAQQVIGQFREHTALNSHELEFHASADPLPVRVDPDALGLALWNLLDNAVKYSPAASTVTVSVEARRDGRAGISVSDQGAGLSRREQKQVFRKFVRGAAADALNVQGTGIGLAMVDRIVHAHGGRVELVSDIGRGSTFTIVLPRTSTQFMPRR